MELDFVKLHGAGNDFVFVDDFSLDVNITPEQVQKICDRHFGIGADGVILVRPSDKPECTAYMHYINSDGTLAQMCGNGVRCFVKYLVDRGFVQATDGSFVADTLAGPRPISFTTTKEGLLQTATVDMGEPVLEPSRVPVKVQATDTTDSGAAYAADCPLQSPWGTFNFTFVSMGNPHAITFIEDFDSLDDALFPEQGPRTLSTFDVQKIGAFFESNDVFPEKANIEFACIENDGIHMRVFERGCGETLACGTGACATNVAAALTNRASLENDLILRGGVLHIVWEDDNHIKMTGPAVQSFSGTFDTNSFI